jgi:MFS family permease
MTVSVLQLLIDKKMMYLNLETFWTGTSMAFWSGILTPILVLQMQESLMTEKEKLSLALMGMVAFGVGNVFGGLFFGVVADKLGPKNACYVNVFLICVQGVVTVFSLDSMHFGILSYTMCFFWGLQDGAVNVHTF